jgi:DNA (cytosine-5)-methyltransferase 1
MNVGSLFSGIGGFDLGLERAGMRVEWQVENNEFCREVLKKHWPKVPCHYDITQIDWRDIPRVDLVCGGFPCQPFSLAGKQRGKADDRYLWPEVVRCLDALRPTWFLGENVPGLINLALDQVCTDLESLGYAVWPVCVPACAVDAPHIRQRVWILAHTERTGSQGHRAERGLREDQGKVQAGGSRGWPCEPAIQRVAHGIPHRMDRLRGLGNAVVPQVVEAFGRMIMEVSQ